MRENRKLLHRDKHRVGFRNSAESLHHLRAQKLNGGNVHG